MTTTPPISNAKLIYQCIVDLANANRVASRQAVANSRQTVVKVLA